MIHLYLSRTIYQPTCLQGNTQSIRLDVIIKSVFEIIDVPLDYFQEKNKILIKISFDIINTIFDNMILENILKYLQNKTSSQSFS